MVDRLPPLLRPEGPEPRDLQLSRRGLASLFFGGYALAAVSAEAQPITTGREGLVDGVVMVRTRSSQMPAYTARPAGRGRYPAIIVIPEVFGIHAYIRDVCRRLAKEGYYAIAPDLFHRAGDPAPLTNFSEIRKIVVTATNEQVMNDIAATLHFLHRDPAVDERRLGVTGFCWGGAVVWMACSRFREFSAGVAWYGRLSRPERDEFLGDEERPWPMDVVHALQAPVLGLYAENDRGIPMADVDRMRRGIDAYRREGSEIVVYPGAQHGFHADYRETYNARAAQDGWRRMLEHFRRNGVAGRPVARAA
jgi:carboxymethylenebutenolidase